jgi:hypothetical protein
MAHNAFRNLPIVGPSFIVIQKQTGIFSLLSNEKKKLRSFVVLIVKQTLSTKRINT